jgi:hypothetical protein
MTSSNDQFTARFETLTDVIRDAIHQTNMGETVELGDLEKKVEKLCADVTKAGKETKQAMQKPMMEMISRLDELAQGLSEHKTRLQNN